MHTKVLKSSRFLFNVAETTKGSSLFPTLFIAFLLYCFILLIARNLGIPKFGVFILVGLSYHTPHVAHDNFEDEIF